MALKSFENTHWHVDIRTTARRVQCVHAANRAKRAHTYKHLCVYIYISLWLEAKVHVLVSVLGFREINVPQICNELPADACPCNFQSQVIFLFANARKLFNKSIYVITTHTYTELRAMIYAHSKCWKFVLK